MVERPIEGSKRPRVVMLLSNPFEVDSRVLKEARSASVAGYEVTVLCIPKQSLPARERREGFDVRRLGRRYNISIFRRFLWYAQSLLWCLKHKPDVIHVNDFDPLPVGWVIAKITRAGLVYDSHELWSQGRAAALRGKWLKWLIRKIEGFFIRRTDVNFQADTSRAEFVARQYGIPQPQTLSNCPTFQDIARTNRLREMTGLGPHNRILLYSGGIAPGRGVGPTLKAIALLPEDIHMVFLGPGQSDEIDEFQRNSPHGSRVHCLKPVPYDEIVPTVSSADVGLSLIQNTNLSYYLGVPNKLFEYMMAGLPAVASDFPEMGRVMRDVNFGELVDPEDPRQIADAVLRILSDPQKYEQYRQNALSGRRKYCWENEVGKLLAAYDELILRRGWCIDFDKRVKTRKVSCFSSK